MSSLAMMTAGIISPTAFEKYGADWNKNPVGTGRFKLEEWKPGIHIAFTRNEDYWGTPAKLEKVIFYPIPSEATRVLSFKAGEIDVCEDLPAHEVPSIEADPNFKIKIQPQLRTVFFGLDMLGVTLKDIRVRKAIAYGIDRESISKYTMEGLAPEAKYGFLPPIIIQKDKLSGYPYDPELAKKLLAEAGYADGLEIELWAPEGRYSKGVEICQVVQGQLKEIGIDVKLNVMEAAVYWNQTCNADLEKKHQMLLLGWGMNADPYATYFALFNTDSITNFFNHRDPGFEAKLLLASRTMDDVKRNEMYLAMDKEVVEEKVIVIPIYYGAMIFAINEKVQDLGTHPMDTLFLEDTWIK
jgi:ABC-type transport system substrate-binding protein